MCLCVGGLRCVFGSMEAPLGVRSASLQVVGVGVVGVGFSLKGDGSIGCVPMTVLYEPIQPFYKVYDVKRYPQQLFLLSCVDKFVIQQPFVDTLDIACPYCAEQIHDILLRH